MHGLRQSNSKDTVIKVLSWLLGVMMAFVVMNLALFGYFTFYYQHNPVTYPHGTVFPVSPSIILQGNPIIATVYRCSKDNYQATVSREIIDGLAYTIPMSTLPFVKGCVMEQRLIPEVTKNLPAGAYYLKSNVEITVRWLYFSRVQKYQTTTQRFTIVAPRIDPVAATDPTVQ